MAEAAAEAEAVSKRQLQHSLRGHGSHLTRHRLTVEAEIKRFMAKPSVELATEMRKLESQVRKRLEVMQDLYSTLEGMEDEDSVTEIVTKKSLENTDLCNNIISFITDLYVYTTSTIYTSKSGMKREMHSTRSGS